MAFCLENKKIEFCKLYIIEGLTSLHCNHFRVMNVWKVWNKLVDQAFRTNVRKCEVYIGTPNPEGATPTIISKEDVI